MKPPSTRSIVRFCLLGIPLGLILCGVTSLFWSFSRDSAKAAGGIPSPAGRALPVTDEAVDQMAQTLRRHVEVLSERIGPRHPGKYAKLEAAKFYLESTLGINNTGYHVVEQNYEIKGKVYTNVEAVLPGTTRADEIIVVGAHYDTVRNTPGADDNASGVAAVLALAQSLHGSFQARTIRFVGFTNEEPPWFQTADMGSLRYAGHLHGEGKKVVAMLALESLGYYADTPGSQKYPPPFASMYPDVGNFIAVVGNLDSRGLVGSIHASIAGTGLIPVEKGAFPAITPGVGWSDHWSFWQYGYPAVMLTGTAPYRNPHYHQRTDRSGTLDYDRFAATVVAIRQALVDLANPL